MTGLTASSFSQAQDQTLMFFSPGGVDNYDPYDVGFKDANKQPLKEEGKDVYSHFGEQKCD